MLKKLKALLSGDTASQPQSDNFEDKQIAAAVLLAEAAASDEGFGDVEQQAILAALKRHFDLDDEAADKLASLGRENQAQAIELFSFTRTIKEAYDYDARLEMIEMLWEVVLADGVLHAYEDQLLRRIAGLLYVEDRDRGEARQRVLDRMNNK